MTTPNNIVTVTTPNNIVTVNVTIHPPELIPAEEWCLTFMYRAPQVNWPPDNNQLAQAERDIALALQAKHRLMIGDTPAYVTEADALRVGTALLLWRRLCDHFCVMHVAGPDILSGAMYIKAEGRLPAVKAVARFLPTGWLETP